jgi:hypothetical protein
MSVFRQHLPPPLNLVYPAIHRAESNLVSQRQKHRSSIVAACIEPSDDLMLVQLATEDYTQDNTEGEDFHDLCDDMM